VAINRRPLLSCQIQPVQHGVNFTVLDPADGAFDQQSYGIQQDWARSS
jgi:hypothetical protein